MRPLARCYLLTALALLALPLLALAQAVVAPTINPDDLGQLLGVALQALSLSGPARWFSLLFVGVLAAVWLVRKMVPATSGAGAFIRTDEGGTLLGWLVSAAGALLAKAIVGGPITWPLAAAAFVAAAGGTGALWSQGRRLLRLFVPLVSKIPGIGGPLAALLGYLSGATAPASVDAAAAAAYKPLSPAPTAQQAADLLAQPPSETP
ncbi:MAG TPA: hypothetical protein VFP50_18165 [Anaeromyxobacteraceae bacterium]|nr:hypothetical protein [Anaeromyxobacteraceae bacterium]